MKNYNFFYDETYQSGSLSIDKNGILTLFSKGSNDMYLGVFVGFNGNLGKLEKDFLKIETKYQYFANKKEFKGSDINNDNFEYGFCSLKNNVCSFYCELFDYLLKNKAKIKIVCFSRTEMLLRNLISFKNVSCDYFFDENSFFYSLTKFFQNYSNDHLKSLLSNYCNQKIGGEEFKNKIIDLLFIVSESCNSPNKQSQKKAFKNLITILKLAKIKEKVDKKDLRFNYLIINVSLLDYLYEVGIDTTNISLLCDENSHVIENFNISSFALIKEGKSKEKFGIRIADHLSCFFGKFTNKISKYLYQKEYVDDFFNMDKELFNNVKWLEKAWFTLNYQQFKLLKKVASLIIGDDKPFWLLTTLSYNDPIYLFCSYLRYFNSYETYRRYSKVTNHHKIGNEYMVLDSYDRFAKMQIEFLIKQKRRLI